MGIEEGKGLMRDSIQGFLGEAHGMEVADADFELIIGALGDEVFILAEKVHWGVGDGEKAIVIFCRNDERGL